MTKMERIQTALLWFIGICAAWLVLDSFGFMTHKPPKLGPWLAPSYSVMKYKIVQPPDKIRALIMVDSIPIGFDKHKLPIYAPVMAPVDTLSGDSITPPISAESGK